LARRYPAVFHRCRHQESRFSAANTGLPAVDFLQKQQDGNKGGTPVGK
jgi:hypothetical protein